MSEATGMADRLAAFLKEADGRAVEVVAYAPIRGGYSRASWRAAVRWADGSEERFVLRGDPTGNRGVFRSDRDAECRLLRALPAAGTVRTPPARYYDATGEHLGTKCIVMAECAGRSLQDVAAESVAAKAVAAKSVAAESIAAESIAAESGDPALRNLFVDTLAAIHRTRLDALPLDVPTDWAAYVERAVATYDDVARAHPTAAPVLRYVTRWLRASIPPPAPLTLVHGDWQPPNVLVADASPPVVIDWEFAHAGDPREDLGYYTQLPMQPHFYWTDPEAFLDRYRRATGLSEDVVNRRAVDWFLMVAIARLFRQLLDAAADVGTERRRGVLATYLLNAVSHLQAMFLRITEEEQ